MTDRRRPFLAIAGAVALIGQAAAAAVRELEERQAAERHERFYGVNRTPPITLRDEQ